MLLSTKSPLCLLCCAVIAVAVPLQLTGLTERDESDLAARGIIWAPRSLPARKRSFSSLDIITITQTEEVQLTETETITEVQLAQQIEEQITVINQRMIDQDNIRTNTFMNRNTNVNTVICVVTEVIDQTDITNINTRYLARQIEAINDVTFEQVTVVMTEIQQLTICGSCNGGSVQTIGTNVISQPAAATTAAAPSIGTYNPSVIPASNQTQLLPSGAAAPNWGQQVETDPAIIIVQNQQVFVEFVETQTTEVIES